MAAVPARVRPLTALHLPRSAGSVNSYASSALGQRSPSQAREIQDMASFGQEGGPLRPIWSRNVRKRREALWYQCLVVPLQLTCVGKQRQRWEGPLKSAGMFFRPADRSGLYIHRIYWVFFLNDRPTFNFALSWDSFPLVYETRCVLNVSKSTPMSLHQDICLKFKYKWPKMNLLFILDRREKI